MSAWECKECGEKYWNEHVCPKDGKAMLERLDDLESKVQELEERLENLLVNK